MSGATCETLCRLGRCPKEERLRKATHQSELDKNQYEGALNASDVLRERLKKQSDLIDEVHKKISLALASGPLAGAEDLLGAKDLLDKFKKENNT